MFARSFKFLPVVITSITDVTCYTKGVPANRAQAAAEAALDTAGLRFAQHRRADSLSGGMKRRLSVAIATVKRRHHLNMPRTQVSSTSFFCFVTTRQVGEAAKLLVLDEPSTGLDPDARHQLWNMLRRFDGSDEGNARLGNGGSARYQQCLVFVTTSRCYFPNLHSQQQ